METLTKPINLWEIDYPVFKLGEEKPMTAEGVSLYLRQYLDENKDVVSKILIVDDKTINKPTLGTRRLELVKLNVKLKPLGKAVFFLGDLIKLANKKSWFIDNAGNIFQYKKDERASLVFRKVTLQINIPSGGSILEVEGIPSRFKILYSPREDERYAGVLVSGRKYILYGVYNHLPTKNTWRMI